MGLCVLYYVEYSLYNVKKVGFFYLGWNCTLNLSLGMMTQEAFVDSVDQNQTAQNVHTVYCTLSTFFFSRL